MTPNEAKTFIATLREKYPRPVSFHAVKTCDSYCIGGCILKEAGLRATFPSAEDVSHQLKKLNPALPEEIADYWACAITTANDEELFDNAWGHVEKALTTNEGGEP